MPMSDTAEPPAVVVHSMKEIEKYAAWVLGTVVTVAVFFQAHVSLPSGVANLNLADPFAILALAAVSLHILFSRQLPQWRISQFNLALGVISLLLALGFMHGWWEIGITQWALGGRLLGWLVLLGYLAAGYVIVANVGTHGLRRFAETLIATAVVVVILQIILRVLYHWGVNTGAHITPNFEGYAGNRNAFAFQLLVVLTLLLGYSQVYARYGCSLQHMGRPWIFSLLLGILLAGLVWSGSRTGMLVGMLVLLLSWLGRLADRRMLGWGVILGALLWCVVWLISEKMHIQDVFLLVQGVFMREIPAASTVVHERALSGSGFVQSALSSDSSNYERWETLTHGLEMWWQSPVLGAGLGVFYAKSPMWMGHSQVIHSTPLWILAEFGLLGGAVFGWVFYLLVRQPARRILLLLLVAFLIFGLTHEIFYQRIFWLVLGAVLAQPFASNRYA
jgi:hypothetical protein